MSDNIKSLVERLREYHRLDMINFDLYLEAADALEQQAARIAELEAAEQPYAYELHLPNDEYSLVYAAYLAKYATAEERACERLALYAAPVADSAMANLFERLMMCGVIDIGEAYLELNVVGYPPTLEEFIAASEPKNGE